MATTIETLKKPNGDQVLPRTRAKAVSMEDGTTVEAVIADIHTAINSLPNVSEHIDSHNTSTDAHNDIRESIKSLETIINNKSDFSGSYNDLTDKPNIPSVEGLASEEYVNTAVAEKIGYTAQDLTDEQKAQARENIGAVSIEKVEEMLGIEEEFSVTGDVVEFDVDVEEGTALEVISKIHRDETWGLSDKLVLHQVSGSNFVDFSNWLGGVGTVIEKNGLTATINADSTVTISGTNESDSRTTIINTTYWSGEHAEKVYPAGIYTIPSGFTMRVRAAQYPNNEVISEVSGNLNGCVTIPAPFRIVTIQYGVSAGATVDVTVPFGLFRGDSIPETGYEYCKHLHTVTFDAPIYEGEFNWSTGELKDNDGNTVAYYDSHDIVSLPGTNYFWTGFGENRVSNLSKDLGKVVIQLNETAPEETVPSICDFQLRPTTPQAVYCLHDSAVRNGGAFYGHEIPLITTKGTLTVVNTQGDVTTEKYVDALINWQGVSDILTNEGIHKVWSDKFFIMKEPVLQEDFSDINNALYTFEFTEEDFQSVGLPAKLDNIPVVSPCFYTGADAASKLNQRVWGGADFPATLSWDASSSKYIFKVRGLYPGYIMHQLTSYTKCYLHYQLETPYTEATTFAMGISSGDTVTFTVDDSDWKTYVDAGLFGDDTANGVDVTPNVSVFVPRNVTDACGGMINAARMLNMENATGGDATVQGYSWIGEGDGVTDYTSRIQSKLDEIHTLSNGGTIHLGTGTYPISDRLVVYDNTIIIGCGIQTVIKQTADNTDAIILNGSDITLKDFCIKLSGACTEPTACVYANSNNSNGDDGYPSNHKVDDLTMDNILMSGKYRFEYADGKPILGDVYNNYKGVGIRANSNLYFNYAHVDNVHGQYLMATIYNGGGGNYYNITAEYCKYAVYIGGINCQYFINGHSYYEGNRTDGYVSMSDYIVYEEGHNNKYSVSLYDTQHFLAYCYFDGRSQNNSYTLNSNFASAIYGNNTSNSENGQHECMVVDLGRANIHVAAYQNIPFAIGNKTTQHSGLTSMAISDPTIRNALSGAGVWGNISSNVTFNNKGIELSEVCRYPSEKTSNVSGRNVPYIVSSVAASESNPVEIEIDISNRPIYGQIGYFIQFDYRYVAANFTVSYDTTGDGVYNLSMDIKNNIDVTTFKIGHQEPPNTIYRIKFTFTKPLQMENFTYEDAGFEPYTINYNPDGLIGICNIGMTVNDYAGRSFLGECGGSLYGNVDMHNNTLKNLPAPVDDGDAVSKAHMESRLAEIGVGDIEAALDAIIEIQNELIGGDDV